jgi:hypothetical protein
LPPFEHKKKKEEGISPTKQARVKKMKASQIACLPQPELCYFVSGGAVNSASERPAKEYEKEDDWSGSTPSMGFAGLVIWVNKQRPGNRSFFN